METAVYRIIDANFNRAREAARLMEEFCRFTLNNTSLSAKAKQLRHILCSTINNLNAERLICCRDIEGDVGKEMQVEGQMSRNDLSDCFTAAAKRLTEALRVLAETSKSLDADAARCFERLRFNAYELEKEIVIFSSTVLKFGKVYLYVLINISQEDDRVEVWRLAKDCITGGADCLQLRHKDLSDSAVLEIAKEFVQICGEGKVLSIINDRADIAVLTGADGVHLGQDDLSCQEIRRLQQKPMIVGISTHNIDQLKNAISQSPTYTAVGPVFSSLTKPGIKAVGLEYVREAGHLLRDNKIGPVAIGGITLDNVEAVLEAGATAIAVSSAVSKADKPEELCKKLKDKIINFSNQQG